MKLLLHACCGPCSIQCVEALAAEGVQLDLLWYNPNIQPETEYQARLDTFCKYLSLSSQDTKLEAYFINPEPNFAPLRLCVNKLERCTFCYRQRLEKTALLAAEKGYTAFTTTLLISPYQNHDLIKQIGEELASQYRLQFLYRDFRPLFRKGQNQAREAGYYMQKYCGCGLE